MAGIFEQMFMPEAAKQGYRADRVCDLRCVLPVSHSPGARPLRCEQSSPQHVQVRQRKGREQPRGVLGQAPVAHLAKAPQSLDHMKGMLAARPGARADAVDELLMRGERFGFVTAPVHPVADATGLGA